MDLRVEAAGLLLRQFVDTQAVHRRIDAAAARAHGVELALRVAPRQPCTLGLAQLIRAVFSHFREQWALGRAA